MSGIAPSFTGIVENGMVEPDSPLREKEWLKHLEGKRVKYSYRIYRDTRSNNQNRYYFGIVLEILSKHTGYENEEMHEICKFKFLRKINDSGMEYIQSTARLDTLEFEEYLDKVKRWAAIELNCVIPDPNT